MGYPTPLGLRCTLRRVARPAQHRGVADVEWCAASGERHDVIGGQVSCCVGGTSVARAPVPVLATPGTEHSCAQALPCPRAVQGVVPAAVRLTSVLGAAATRAAGDDTTDRAQLHGTARVGADTVEARLTLVTLDCTPFDIETSVSETDAPVYSPAVLRLRGQDLRIALPLASGRPSSGHGSSGDRSCPEGLLALVQSGACEKLSPTHSSSSGWTHWPGFHRPALVACAPSTGIGARSS